MTLKIGILISLRRLFIILVSLTMTLFSEEMLISTRCIRGLMPNLNKKSLMVSNSHVLTSTVGVKVTFGKSALMNLMVAT